MVAGASIVGAVSYIGDKLIGRENVDFLDFAFYCFVVFPIGFVCNNPVTYHCW